MLIWIPVWAISVGIRVYAVGKARPYDSFNMGPLWDPFRNVV